MSLQPVSSSPLAGHRVLVVEDEYFLADDIVRALQALGARVIGPYGELEDATRVLDDDGAIDAAIIDINLRSEMVFPLARVLRARNIPFVFATGYDRGTIDAEFQDIRVWEKPVDLAAMARDLGNLIRGR
jgi:DNA-binding response OmpR family regulator